MSLDLPKARVYGQPSASVGRLVIRGQFFYFESGEPWTALESSDFALYKRYLAGEDIAPILSERRDLGFNLLRVWLLNVSVIPGGLTPSQYPEFYDRMPAFLALCGSYGLWVEFTVFTQAQTLMPNRGDQQRHLDQTVAAVCFSSNVLLELVNEADQHDNDGGCTGLSQPEGVLCSHGSNGADSAPPGDPWDYVLYHSNDLPEFQRKVGHNAMEFADQFHVPAMSNENTRYADRDASESHAFDAAAGGALLTAGSCFHSQSGKVSAPFSADERRFAAAWVAGARSIPLEFRTGAYSHRADLEGPDCIRAYEKRLPDGRSYILKIRP